MFNRILALILLIMFLPIMIFISIIIYITSGFPIIFTSRRCGHKFKEFNIYKFRTMKENNGPLITQSNDSRIIPIGHLLRRYKMDELPQLMNIIRGEMVFIGPRPEAAEIVKNHKHLFSYLDTIQSGVTDISSVIFKDETDIIKIYDTEKYIEIILPLKYQLTDYTLNEYIFFKKIALFLISALSVIHHKLSLRIVSKFFLPYKEEELRIRLNKLLSNDIF